MGFNSTRRRLLKVAGLGAAALAAAPRRPLLASAPRQGREPNNSCGIEYDYMDTTISFNEMYDNPPMLGRVHGAYWIRIFKEPRPDSPTICSAQWGYVMPIYRGVRTVPYDARAASPVWFETNLGYVHSAYVVPGHENFQDPITPSDFTEPFWGEISVPISWQYWRPSLQVTPYDWDYYKGIYGQVHKVIDVRNDEEGRIWYRLYDDVEENRLAWVLGKHVRIIQPKEFAPISPNVENKKIIIHLDAQTLTCYENDQSVFMTRIASGSSFRDDEGNLHDFATVEGHYFIERKRPSRRMRGGDPAVGTNYDVNAVPWVTYFGHTGAAIHGAYWHNNFGTPRSHGCINVTPDAAHWIYRWTQPHFGYDVEYQWREEGEASTDIQVI